MIDLAVRLFDPPALLIVLGGTAFAAVVGATRDELARALGALKPLLRARPARDAEVAGHAVRQIQRISEYKGVVCADRVKTPIDFVHRAACRLADAADSAAFARWAEEELDSRRVRHEGAAAVWRSAADAAPAMGMIGTVIGLVGMFSAMRDPAAMGPALATAMLTTFYGLALAAGIAGPVAARLERLSRAELRWQEKVLERLTALARAEEEATALRHWARGPRLAG